MTFTSKQINDVNKMNKAAQNVKLGELISSYNNSKPYNVKDFGAVGDGIVDDTSFIQATLDKVPNSGGIVFFPPGIYRITDNLFTKTGNIALIGCGGQGQSNYLGKGTSVIKLDKDNIVGFTFNDATTTLFQGPLLRDLHFWDSKGTATGAIWLRRCNNFRLENISISDFTSGYGVFSDGTGNCNQYGALIECRMANCFIGIRCVLTNGLRLLGCYVDGNNNSPENLPSGSIGIKVESGDSFRAIGTIIQMVETLVSLEGGTNHELTSCRYEGFVTGVYVAADYCQIIGGSMNNYIAGGGGTGIIVDSSANKTFIIIGPTVAVGTTVSDSGTSTVYYHDRVFHFGVDGQIKIGDDITLLRGYNGALQVLDSLWANRHLKLDIVNDKSCIYWGSAQDTVLYREAANNLKTDDILTVGTGAWDAGHLTLGTYHLWITSTGKLMIKNGAPTNETDGVVVGTQS